VQKTLSSSDIFHIRIIQHRLQSVSNYLKRINYSSIVAVMDNGTHSTLSISAPPTQLGETIPSNTPHAVSVTLPTWQSNVAYEEGEHWVHSKMKSGYPRSINLTKSADIDRFMIHEKIQEVSNLDYTILIISWRNYVLNDTATRQKEQCYFLHAE
jgi:hypothetical protein